jgi:hypothetical protein
MTLPSIHISLKKITRPEKREKKGNISRDIQRPLIQNPAENNNK